MTRRQAARGALTLQAAFDLYAADLIAANRSVLTVEWYHYRLCRRFRHFLTTRSLPDDVRQVRREHLRDLVGFLTTEYWADDAAGRREPRRLSPHTISGTAKAVRAFFSWLAREQLIAADPGDNVSTPTPHSEPRPAYTEDEISRMLALPRRKHALAMRNRAFVGFIAETGCRVSEARTLRLTDLDLTTRRATITGKGNRRRVVPVSDGLARLLTEYLEQTRPRLARADGGPWMFLTEDGVQMSLSAAEQMFKRLCRRSGVTSKGRGVHGLRRSFTVRWIKRGGDPYMLRLILGHSGLAIIANHYAALLPSDIDEKFRRLGVSVLDMAIATAPETAAPTSSTERHPTERHRRLLRRSTRHRRRHFVRSP